MVQTLVGVIETYFVSQLGTDALAGAAVVLPVLMLMQMMANGGFGGGVALRRVPRDRGRASGRRAGVAVSCRRAGRRPWFGFHSSCHCWRALSLSRAWRRLWCACRRAGLLECDFCRRSPAVDERVARRGPAWRGPRARSGGDQPCRRDCARAVVAAVDLRMGADPAFRYCRRRRCGRDLFHGECAGARYLSLLGPHWPAAEAHAAALGAFQRHSRASAACPRSARFRQISPSRSSPAPLASMVRMQSPAMA